MCSNWFYPPVGSAGAFLINPIEKRRPSEIYIEQLERIGVQVDDLILVGQRANIKYRVYLACCTKLKIPVVISCVLTILADRVCFQITILSKFYLLYN
jgi:hypothetical protein